LTSDHDIDVPDVGVASSPKNGVRGALSSLILSRAFVPVGLIAAAAVRVTWIIWYPAKPVSDFGWYRGVGVSIAQGHGFQFFGQPTANRSPGYPLLLALSNILSGNSLLANRILTAAFGVGTIWLAYLIARGLFRSEITGRLTLLLLAFFPNQIAYSGIIASELPFSFFVLLGAWILLFRRRSIWTLSAAGAAFGSALLIRPAALVLPVVVLVAALWRSGWKALLRGVVVVYVVIGLLLAPWLIRNEVAFGKLAYSTEGGEALLEGTFPALKTGRQVTALSFKLVPPTGDAITDDANRLHYALTYIKAHPVYMIRLLPSKLYHMNWADSDGIAWTIEGLQRPGEPFRASLVTWGRVADDYYLSILILAFGGLIIGFVRRSRGAPFSSIPFWVWLATVLFYLPFAGAARYHAPVIPWITMYAGALCAMSLGRNHDVVPGDFPPDVTPHPVAD
jgi:4-amino-4-deoxy-L-arabinose transferase-like glycosyltransferase